MRRIAILLASIACVAMPAFAQAPTPPVAPPLPQPGQAEPMLQPQAAGHRPPPPEGGKKDQKWDVAARHGPGRDVPIDSREGTWMSLDVSPDGREIAFDLLGDLYVMPIGGGEARAIATGMPVGHAAALFARAAREIAFTSDRGGGDNIWVMNRDGTGPRAITKETSAC